MNRNITLPSVALVITLTACTLSFDSAQEAESSSAEATTAEASAVANVDTLATAESIVVKETLPLTWEVVGAETQLNLKASQEPFILLFHGDQGIEGVKALCPPDDSYRLSGSQTIAAAPLSAFLECRPGKACLPCTQGADCVINPCPPPR